MKTIEKRKVLQIITLFSIGGATENTVSTAAGLIKKGYKVDIATGPNLSSEGSMYEIAEELNLPVITFPHLKRAITPIHDFIIIVQLAIFIRKNRYDIVHTHSSKAGVVGRIAAWLAGTPVRIHTIHGLPFHQYQGWLLRNLFKLIEKFAALTCHKLVSVTHTIVDVMLKNRLAPKNKFVVIRSGFDIENYVNNNYNNLNTRQKYNLNADDVLIGKISRISILKGHKYLLSAFKMISEKIPRAKLVLVGNGEYEVELKEKISKMNLDDKIIFTGMVPPDEIPEIINMLDVVVHTSLLEGLARVFAQSIMLGKPVISFDLDGSHEVIKDGVNGYLIEPENIDMLADKIIDLAGDLDKAKRFGKAGKVFLKDEFSSENMVKKTHHLYTELLKKV